MTTTPVPATERVTVLDSLDWGAFVRDHWDRSPVLIKGVRPRPFEESEVFPAAVRAAVPPVRGVLPVNVQFTIGRDQQIAPGDWLPRDGDGSLDGYHRRLTEELGGRRYALVLHGFHSFHAAQRARERAFLAGLWEHTGIPLTGAITTLFHGTYEHSPVGAHQDRFATFMFALRGSKRMRFWSRRPWSDPVSSVLDYQPYLDTSFVAEAEPGDLLYWPDSYVHVGESDLGTEPATSVNIGVPRTGHLARYDIEDFLYDTTEHSLVTAAFDPSRRPAEPGGLLMPPGDGGPELSGALPPGLAEALTAFETAGDEQRLRERAAVLSLRRWTAGGLLPGAPEPLRPLPPQTVVALAAPVRWTDCGSVRMCAALGHVTRTALSPSALRALLTALHPDGPASVAGRLPGTDAEPERSGVLRLLAELESFGALTRTGEANGAGDGDKGGDGPRTCGT